MSQPGGPEKIIEQNDLHLRKEKSQEAVGKSSKVQSVCSYAPNYMVLMFLCSAV